MSSTAVTSGASKPVYNVVVLCSLIGGLSAAYKIGKFVHGRNHNESTLVRWITTSSSAAFSFAAGAIATGVTLTHSVIVIPAVVGITGFISILDAM